MREFTVPPMATLPDTTHLTNPVWENAEKASSSAQFRRRTTEGGWAPISCLQFRDEVLALARGLIAAGIEPGARIGLMSSTRYEWSLVDFAAWACGAVTVPIYETSSAEQVEWILSDSGAVACVVETAAHAAIVEKVRRGLPLLRHVWLIEEGPGERLEEVAAGGSATDPAEVDARRRAARADDTATLIYTSGTTGRPKGCMLTHRNLYADAANAIPALRHIMHPGASTLLFLPLAHSFARLIQNAFVIEHAELCHSADLKNLVADLKAVQPTFVLSVPRVFEKFFNTAKQQAHGSGKGWAFDVATETAIAYSEALDRPGGPRLGLRLRHQLFERLVYRRLREAFGGRCRDAISGGAPLGERLTHFFRGAGVTILEGYGLTETSPAAAVNLLGATRVGTVGRPLPGVGIRIADDGEILISGDIVFKGYWENPEATAEALDPEGWLHSGDLGNLDSDGYLRVTGRKKEIIVTASGKNVAPALLEDRIRSHPLVSQCMVVGDRQPFVAALITLDEEALPGWLAGKGRPTTATAAELRDDPELNADVQRAVDEANQSVSRAESIKVFRILARDFTEATGEMTPSMKVRRNVVQKEHADEIAAIYARR